MDAGFQALSFSVFLQNKVLFAENKGYLYNPGKLWQINRRLNSFISYRSSFFLQYNL